jgi:hypothetical protein
MNRWYDKHKKLRRHLDALKGMAPRLRTPLVKRIMALIRERDPRLVAETEAMEFPLDMLRRRWYDRDPLLWLMFNGLKGADLALLREVTACLDAAAKK